jgi:hypothetical protein
MKISIKTILTILIAAVWLINGLLCKLLNLVPRHQMIVSRILGNTYSQALTKTIGILEILMFVWIVSKIKPRWCALFQIAIVAAMNLIEFFLVPDLLLFGRMNAIIATIFIGLIYSNEYIIDDKKLNIESNS